MYLKRVRKIFNIKFGFHIDFFNQIIQELKLNKNTRILNVDTWVGIIALALALNNHTLITGEPLPLKNKTRRFF